MTTKEVIGLRILLYSYETSAKEITTGHELFMRQEAPSVRVG